MRAEIIAKALGGYKTGRSWMARCPAHDDSTPSLSISTGDNGSVLVYCHGLCDQSHVIAALRSRGLWGDDVIPAIDIKQRHNQKTSRDLEEENKKRSLYALRIWNDCIQAHGALVETYLKARGLNLPLPNSIRFHSGLKHQSSEYLPAMVALVTHGKDISPLAIHRTFLSHDGLSKAAVVPQKMMLGPCRGGVVRLAIPSDTLMVGEGIETCLAAMQATGKPAWAALSTSGLRALELPEYVRDVIVLADGDGAGETAAYEAGRNWRREGRLVRIARPPQGLDFNDMLLGRMPPVKKGWA